MLLLQMLASAASVQALRSTGSVAIAPLSMQRARGLLPTAVLYASNVGFALASLDGMSVVTYTVIKRLTPAFVLAHSRFFRGALPSRPVLASVALTLLGCLLAGAGDLQFDAKAYAMGVASCVLQAGYLISVQARPLAAPLLTCTFTPKSLFVPSPH